MGLWQVRILFMRRSGILFWSVGCLVIGSIVINQRLHHHQLMRMTNPHNIIQNHVVVSGDEITQMGRVITFTGWWQEGHQRIKGRVSQQCHNISTDKKYTVVFDGTVQAIAVPTNEAQHDWRLEAQARGIVNDLKINRCRFIPTPLKIGVDYVKAFRGALIRYCSCLNEPLRWFALALLTGKLENTELTNQVRQLGMLYLFCLSGYHVFLIRWLVSRLVRLLGGTSQWERWFFIGGLPLWVVIGGSSPGLVRAGLMVFLMDIVYWKGRRVFNGIESWAVVLAGNVLWSPAAIFQMGVQLSYLLTLGLIIFAELHLKVFRLNMALNILGLPLILWHTFQFNLLTVPLAIIGTIVFNVIIVPVTVLGVVFPGLQGVAVEILRLITAGIGFLSTLSTIITVGRPAVIFCVGWIIGCLRWPPERWWRYVLLGSCLLIQWLVIRAPLSDEIVYFDVGQGDCSLIRSETSHNITMIDTGGRIGGRHYRQGTPEIQAVGDYLLSRGINQIDQLILTHKDTDHIGNFPALSHRIKVRRLFVPAGMERQRRFKVEVQQATFNSTQLIPLTTRNASQLCGMTVLWPPTQSNGDNSSSVTVITNFHGIKCWFSGDLEQSQEQKIIQTYPNLQIDVLKCGHHGSKTATSPKLVTQTHPRLAVISVGKNNRYGHPAPVTLKTLAQHQVPVFMTSHDGMVKLEWRWLNRVKFKTVVTRRRGICG
ncbi:ComEC/Rec2 family competence protein [Ligilactobacillus sp. LYQ139]|uniref:ComEC/Rec2 family competence protein n=1 Tax=Ligilactobacillus sp. LYQ139 TaxID=3378800 RepID=UPI003855583E